MSILREWCRRLIGTLYADRRDAEMAEELRTHMEFSAQHGRPVGGVTQAMDAMRDQRGLPWFDDVIRDVRHGFRSVRRSPVFTAMALLTLAVGIGANTAIFSVVNAVLLRPLGYPKPEQLMQLTSRYRDLPIVTVSVPEYAELRQMNRSFATIGAYTTVGTSEVNLTAGDRPLRVRSIAVDAHLLAVLGIQPAQGRFFTVEETSRWSGTLAPPLAILSHELWQRAFGGASIVGTTVSVEGRPHQVLGIMPPGADLMDQRAEIWLPLWIHPAAAAQRGTHVLNVIARLREGVSPKAAEVELNGLLDNWRAGVDADGHVPVRNPSLAADHTLQIQPLRDATVGAAGRSIWVLQSAVGFLLLVVCANLTNLVMARSDARRGEFVLRTALGASRARLFRQGVTEGMLIAVPGLLLALWLARIGIDTLVRLYPTSLPRSSEIAIDFVVVIVAFGLTSATALLFGLMPIDNRKSSTLVAALKQSGERGASGARHGLRNALVTAEIALAVMLVIGAGLLLRTVQSLWSVESGFDRSRLVTFSMTLPMATSEPESRAQAYQRLLERLRATPGVEAATVMSGLPPNRSSDAVVTRIENYTGPDGRPGDIIDYYQFVMGDYFKTMGVPVVAGRGFEPADAASEGKVVVINEAMARRLWRVWFSS